MLAISNRGTKADMFWFTLFHEIAHVLMEHKRQILFSLDDQEDIEADKKAAELLIPNKYWNEFIKAGIFNKDSIQNFAQRLNILPCIVLGRLRKERPDLVPYGKYDKDFSISYDIDSVIEL